MSSAQAAAIIESRSLPLHIVTNTHELNRAVSKPQPPPASTLGTIGCEAEGRAPAGGRVIPLYTRSNFGRPPARCASFPAALSPQPPAG